MPEEHITTKLPETAEEKAVRTEQQLADELEENRGILPGWLRNVLIGVVLVVVAGGATLYVIFNFPRTAQEAPQETPTPVPVDELPTAVREGRIAKVLGASTGPVSQRARALMKNETIIITRPVGVIPHPYLQSQYAAGYTATALREITARDTVFTVTASLPDTDNSEGYTVYVGSENTPAREIGTMVRVNIGSFTMSATMSGAAVEPTIFIVGPDPKNPDRKVTLLSGVFQIL